MGLSELLILGGVALLIKNGMKKETANQEDTADDFASRCMADSKAFQEEWERCCEVNRKRRALTCRFDDGLSQSEFREFAQRAGRKTKRVKSVSVNGAVIYCNVESQTGYTDWNFSLDFNNWGHVTGTYWTQTDNDDSSIPHYYGQLVAGWIIDFYRERGIRLLDFSSAVDNNKDLGTPRELSYNAKKRYANKVYKEIIQNVGVHYGTTDLIGEHLYPVISTLRDTGFNYIKAIPIQDLNDHTTQFYYQVEQVIINGSGFFEYGMLFPNNAEVIITYHERQKIKMPFSEKEVKNKNYSAVGDELLGLGFTQVYSRKIEDLVTGWVTKEGAVESILVDGKEGKPICKNAMYDYEQKLVICYHTKKP